MRPMMSVPPPAACELMNLIGRSGQVCALAAKLQGAAQQCGKQQPAEQFCSSSVSPGSDAARFRDRCSVPSLPGPTSRLVDWPRAPDGRGLSWAHRDSPRIEPMNVLNLPRPAWMTEDLVLLEEQARRFMRPSSCRISTSGTTSTCIRARSGPRPAQAGLLCAVDAGGIRRRRRHASRTRRSSTANTASPASTRSARRCIPASSRPTSCITAPRSRRSAGCRSSPPASWSAPSP